MSDPGHFVVDHGIESLRKSIIPIDGYPQEYQVRTLGKGTFISQAITSSTDGIRVTRKTITDVPTRFPLIGETIHPDRNTISILNDDLLNSIYFHVLSTFTSGWVEGSVKGPQRIGPGESFNSPCNADVYIWIACETGKTARVEFGEYA